MKVSLKKGGIVNLNQDILNLSQVRIGLGWDARATDGQPFDLDASIFMVKDDGKVPSDDYFVFYNQLRSPEGAVIHTGDNPTGKGEVEDDETIRVQLSRIPEVVQRLVIVVTIHDANIRHQSFGQVNNAFVRIVDDATDKELARFDLTEDYSVETAVIFGELHREGHNWQFVANGQGFAGGLMALALRHGVDV